MPTEISPSGGAIALLEIFESFPFISALSKKGLYAFESRKCTFKTSESLKKNNFNSLNSSALEFELSWLNCKKNLYGDRSQEEDLRIKTIQSRLKNPII